MPRFKVPVLHIITPTHDIYCTMQAGRDVTIAHMTRGLPAGSTWEVVPARTKITPRRITKGASSHGEPFDHPGEEGGGNVVSLDAAREALRRRLGG